MTLLLASLEGNALGISVHSDPLIGAIHSFLTNPNLLSNAAL